MICALLRTNHFNILGDGMAENRPFDVLDGALNKSVIIRLKGGTELRGVMAAYDVHMNIVLQNAEQLENGELKRKLGTMLLRGDSIIFLSPVETP